MKRFLYRFIYELESWFFKRKGYREWWDKHHDPEENVVEDKECPVCEKNEWELVVVKDCPLCGEDHDALKCTTCGHLEEPEVTHCKVIDCKKCTVKTNLCPPVFNENLKVYNILTGKKSLEEPKAVKRVVLCPGCKKDITDSEKHFKPLGYYCFECDIFLDPDEEITTVS